MARVTRNDLAMPLEYFTTIGGFTPEEFRTFTGQNAHMLTNNGNGTYNVFEIMSIINSDRRVLKKNQKTKKELQAEQEGPKVQSKYEEDLAKEKLLEARIKNQKVLGTLIPKSEARVRVKQAWSTVRNKILYSAKSAAQLAIGMTDPRHIETILIREYNKAINSIQDDAEMISWDQDGSTELLRTRVMSITEEEEESRIREIVEAEELAGEVTDGDFSGSTDLVDFDSPTDSEAGYGEDEA